MAELMFFTRKEISPYQYAKEGREGWTAEYHNVEVLADYYETTITADSDGKFPEGDLPSITFTFGIEGEDTPNYGKFVADYFKIKMLINGENYADYYRTKVRVQFFKEENIIYTLNSLDDLFFSEYDGYHNHKYFLDARDFDKIVISFTEAPSGNTGKIYDFCVDLLYPKVLDNKPLTINKFSSFKIKEAINVLSDDMPMGSLECDIVSDVEFNIKKTTLFDVENNGKYYGRFVVVDFKRTGDKSYHLSANSLKELLEREEYSDWQIDRYFVPETLYKKTNGILGFAIPELKNSVIKVCDGYIDVGTCRHALCQYAWAQNLMASDARKSYIELVSIPKIVKHKITNSGGKKKIIGNATLNETPQSLYAKYTMFSYDYPDNEFDENGNNTSITEIGLVQGILTTKQTYYFEKPPARINFQASGLNDYIGDLPSAGKKWTVYDNSNSKISFIANYDVGGDNTSKLVLKGRQSTKKEYSVLIDRDVAYLGEGLSGVKEYNKYTLCIVDLISRMLIDIKSPMIKKVLESRGEVKAKIVLEDEQVGDLVDIDTAFEGTIRGIITSMEYTPNFQTIADITIQALDIGLEPLYDEDGKPIYDKLDDIILVEGDA
jgi:hypothetical protein